MSREIMRAIFKGDLEALDSFIAQGLDPREITEVERWNLLHRALVPVADSQRPEPRIIQRLIEFGVDVDGTDSYGNTPLHYACRTNSHEVVRLLLDAGADVNHFNSDGIAPLRQALLAVPHSDEETGHLNITLELLLKRGADLDAKAPDGVSDREYIELIAHGKRAYLLDLFNR